MGSGGDGNEGEGNWWGGEGGWGEGGGCPPQASSTSLLWPSAIQSRFTEAWLAILVCAPLGDMRITSYLRIRRVPIIYVKSLSSEMITIVCEAGWSHACTIISTWGEIQLEGRKYILNTYQSSSWRLPPSVHYWDSQLTSRLRSKVPSAGLTMNDYWSQDTFWRTVWIRKFAVKIESSWRLHGRTQPWGLIVRHLDGMSQDNYKLTV